MLRFAVVVSLASLAMLSPAMAAAGYPDAQCGLSSDKSSLTVTASNGGAQGYQCEAFCKAHVAATHSFDNFNCTFNLAKGGAPKVVCTKKGGAPNYYSDVQPTKFTCSPR